MDGYPLAAGAGGIKVRPELMEVEKLYHCVFRGRVMLVYKDGQQVLHCYEVEGDGGLADRVGRCRSADEAERILMEHAEGRGRAEVNR